MCGIFGYVGPRSDAVDVVFDGIKSLEYRGYDSWGIVVAPEGEKKLVIKKKAGKIGDALVKDMPRGSIALGHTRWATHGGVTDANAHPHLDCTQTIAVVHNGIFENYFNLKNKLVAKGHRFLSETDTEVISHLIEDQRKHNDFITSVKNVFKSMDGLNAIIALEEESRTMVAARNGSPLVIGFGKNENFVASDASALLPYTRRVYFLEENEMAIIEENHVQIINIQTGQQIEPLIQKLNWTIDQVRKGDYPHFMLKEINEQPKVLHHILNSALEKVEPLVKQLTQSNRIFFVGCGTANHVGMISSYLLSIISGVYADSIAGSEFDYYKAFLDKNSYTVFFSQSGETIDVVQPAFDLQKRKLQFAAVTNRMGSSLYRMANQKVLVDAGPEICVLSTKSFTAKLAIMLLTSYFMVNKPKEGKQLLKKAIEATTQILNQDYYQHYIQPLVGRLVNAEHIYSIGRGISYPIALEAALKIKEVSYIHTEGFAGGELKHGVIALIVKGTPCLVFAPEDETYTTAISNAMEIKARGGYIIGISSKPNEVFDWYLPIQNSMIASIIPSSVVIQLLSYYIAVSKGNDPDKPRNLAKSVTVR